MRIKRIHHLTVVVKDVEGARLTFEQLFGERATDAVPIPAFGIRSATLPLGDSTLELATPADLDNPAMRFLERSGEGFYNLALEVDDLDAAIEELVALGVRVSEPIEAERGLRSCFVTMAATHGLSLQLIEVVGERPPDRSPRAATSPDLESGQPAIAGATAGPKPADPSSRALARSSVSAGDGIRLDGIPRAVEMPADTANEPASTVAPSSFQPPSRPARRSAVEPDSSSAKPADTPVEPWPEPPMLDLTPDEWSDAD